MPLKGCKMCIRDRIYNQLQVPNWGPSIEGLNMDEIVTYVRPNTHMSAKWSDRCV